MAERKAKKPQQVKIKATITVETSFTPYDNEDLNKKAMAQIQGWLNETLNDDEFIPLFVANPHGEQTNAKKVKVVLERVGKK